MATDIIRANAEHLEILLPVFAGYRRFYEQTPDPAVERAFLSERLSLKDSVIFLAINDDSAHQASGFVQLYPSFDSVDAGPIWILHDLYVADDSRRSGIGRQLMNEARDYCRTTKAVRIDLSTAINNSTAKGLYESLGYERDNEFDHYSLSL